MSIPASSLSQPLFQSSPAQAPWSEFGLGLPKLPGPLAMPGGSITGLGMSQFTPQESAALRANFLQSGIPSPQAMGHMQQIGQLMAGNLQGGLWY